jgi:hypothetical protein
LSQDIQWLRLERDRVVFANVLNDVVDERQALIAADTQMLLEIADFFRAHGAVWRRANAGHISLTRLKVMNAIERCRTAALGGHLTAV